MEGERFPQYLNSPFTILWWEADEINVMMLCLGLAYVFGGWPLWISVLVLPWMYRRQKKAYPRGFLKHVLYFVGLSHLKNYPGYFESSFYE